MPDLDETELGRLQNQSVAVMAAAERGDSFSVAESTAAVAVVLAVPSLCDEIRHLREVEREAQRILGAVVYYQAGGYVALSEGALGDEYVVERTPDVAAAKVQFKAWPTERRGS